MMATPRVSDRAAERLARSVRGHQGAWAALGFAALIGAYLAPVLGYAFPPPLPR
jgi:hypothetical protein